MGKIDQALGKGVHPFDVIHSSWLLTQEETPVYNCDIRLCTMHDQTYYK